MRTTHTYALMEVSQIVYNEIFYKLEKAGYDHAIIHEDGEQLLVMQGIALKMVAGGVTYDEPSDNPALGTQFPGNEEPNIRSLSAEEQEALADEADNLDNHAVAVDDVVTTQPRQLYDDHYGRSLSDAYAKMGENEPQSPLKLDPDGFLKDEPAPTRGRQADWIDRLKPWNPSKEPGTPYLRTDRNSRGEPATGQRVIAYRCPYCNTLHEGVIETELPRFRCLCKV